jgi:hypothetical protein
MVIGDKVSYQRDVAGFRPTPPPYWPKPVVLAVMDTLKENIHAFIDETDRFGVAFRQLASIPHMPPADARQQRITFTLGGEQASMSLDSLINLKNILAPLSSSVLMATGGADGVDNPASGRLGAKTVVEAPGRPEMEFRSIGMSPRQSSPLFGGDENDRVRHWKDVRFIIAAYSKNENYFRDGLTHSDASEIYVLFEQMIHKYSRTEFNQLADETLNLLSIFMEVEETSRHKYNYAMTENDRAFVLYLLNRLFDTIQVQPEWGDGSGDGGPGGRSDAEIVNVLRHMQGPDQALTEDQLSNRLQFIRRLTAIADSLREDARAGGHHEPTESEITRIFDTLQSEFGQSPWARRHIANERARSLNPEDTEDLGRSMYSELTRRDLELLAGDQPEWMGEVDPRLLESRYRQLPSNFPQDPTW